VTFGKVTACSAELRDGVSVTVELDRTNCKRYRIRPSINAIATASIILTALRRRTII
jgi:hypothetical protein